jgi:hypothetical protein
MTMKILFASILLVILGVCCLAQERSAPTDGPDLVAIAQKWHSETRNPALDGDWDKKANDSIEQREKIRDNQRVNDQRQARGLPPLDPPRPTVSPAKPRKDPSLTYFYEVTLRNENKKNVAAVTWEYVFEDRDTGREVGRRRFESRTSIGSGKTRDLEQRSSIPPTGTINAATSNKTSNADRYSEKIVIVKIEYSDGSIWSAATK